MAKAEANGNASHEQQLLDYSKECVQLAYDYFYLKLNNDLKPVLHAFKAARLFSPFKFHELKPSATDIDCLKAFPLLNSQETIDGLKMKTPMLKMSLQRLIKLLGGRDMLLSFLNGLMLLKWYY